MTWCDVVRFSNWILWDHDIAQLFFRNDTINPICKTDVVFCDSFWCYKHSVHEDLLFCCGLFGFSAWRGA